MTEASEPAPARSDRPPTATELDTAHAASRNAPDGFLVSLLELADGHAGLGVGLLVNGMVVMGQLAPGEDMATAIDEERQRLFDRIPEAPEGTTDEEWAEARDRFSRQSRDAYERYRSDVAQLNEDLGEHVGDQEWDVDTLPLHLARRVIAANERSHLTLREAKVFAPSQVGVTQIQVMRLQLAQIAAWWVMKTDAAGNSSFTLWDTNVPGVTAGER